MTVEDAYYRMIHLLENDLMHMEDDIGTDNLKILSRREEAKISMEKLIEILEKKKDILLEDEDYDSEIEDKF